MSIDFSNFPWVSTSQFESASVDVTQYEDDFFVAHLSYFSCDEDDRVDEGMILELPLYGSSLGEISVKLNVLMSIDFFTEVELMSHGDLFNSDGETIGHVCWPSGGKVTPVEKPEPKSETPTVTVTIPHQPVLH